jgi:hypothetical protein
MRAPGCLFVKYLLICVMSAFSFPSIRNALLCSLFYLLVGRARTQISSLPKVNCDHTMIGQDLSEGREMSRWWWNRKWTARSRNASLQRCCQNNFILIQTDWFNSVFNPLLVNKEAHANNKSETATLLDTILKQWSPVSRICVLTLSSHLFCLPRGHFPHEDDVHISRFSHPTSCSFYFGIERTTQCLK